MLSVRAVEGRFDRDQVYNTPLSVTVCQIAKLPNCQIVQGDNTCGGIGEYLAGNRTIAVEGCHRDKM